MIKLKIPPEIKEKYTQYHLKIKKAMTAEPNKNNAPKVLTAALSEFNKPSLFQS
ncbi:MAG: hypothetical protein JKZ03_04160 [Flavobacteriaceae bacterium]|nr:hypothetical protein [Flavobacteriaceae bacterium]